MCQKWLHDGLFGPWLYLRTVQRQSGLESVRRPKAASLSEPKNLTTLVVRVCQWFENEGNVAMNILWRPRLAVTPQTIGDIFDYSVAPMPAGKAGSVGLTKMNPLAINSHTKNMEAAWKYLRFWLSEPS